MAGGRGRRDRRRRRGALGPAGIAIPLVALAIAGAVLAARPLPLDLDAAGGAAAALLLTAMAVVRDAGWLVLVDVAAAAGCAAVAVRGAATWGEVFGAPFRVARAGLRVPAVFGRLIPRHGTSSWPSPLGRALVVSAVLLVAFGSLFASADAAFARIAGDILFPDVDTELLPARVVVALLVTGGAGGLILAAARTEPEPAPGDLWTRERRRPATVEWALPLALLDALFAAFVVVQVAVLFGGHRHVLTTQGLTYAEYARAGFFQLVAVAALTLGVVALARKLVVDERAERLLKALLGTLCVLTLVILASALRRLNLYEATYGLTRIRVSVYAVDLWLAGLFALVMIAGLFRKAPWLPRAVLAFSAAALLAFNAADPDAQIARSGVERWRETGELDRYYLSTLSADAVAPLTELPPEERACVLAPIEQRLGAAEPWTSFNVSRSRARDLLATEGNLCSYR